MIEGIKQSDILRAEIYVNKGRKTMASVVKELGCTHIINAGLFDMDSFKPASYLIKDRKVLCAQGDHYGYAFSGSKIAYSYANSVNYPDFVGGYPKIVTNGRRSFDKVPAGLSGNRARSAIGLSTDSIVLFCVSETDGVDLFTLADIMIAQGCVTAINLDGGGSSQCVFSGRTVSSSRIVHSFICIWAKEAETAELGEYVNGSKSAAVYETTQCAKQIGLLFPNERCGKLHEGAGFVVVYYDITGTPYKKVGFVRK